MASPEMSVVERPSPFDGLEWLQQDRERLAQLEIPGADIDRGRRALELWAQHEALDAQRRANDLTIRRDERIEKQEAAMGWIQVCAVALTVPALVIVIVLVALGEAEPWVLGPLLAAACGGAALPIFNVARRSADAATGS